MAINKYFKNAISKINNIAKKTPQQKAAETRSHVQRLAEMQRYVDMSEIKRKELINVLNSPASDGAEGTILNKGAIVYAELLDVIDILKRDLEANNIEVMEVTGKTSQNKRGEVCKWFKENPHNKVVLISSCGGESLNLNHTNEMILYNVPKGSGKFAQLIGRVDRLFGKFHEFFVHMVIVEDTIDEYKQILLSSKKELELEILTQDTIPLKTVGSFDQMVLKKIRKHLLWKNGKTRTNPKKLTKKEQEQIERY